MYGVTNIESFEVHETLLMKFFGLLYLESRDTTRLRNGSNCLPANHVPEYFTL